MTTDEARELQRELAKCKAGREFRYPPALRKRVGEWVVERRRCGDLWVDIAKALRLSTQTLTRWAAEQQPLDMVPIDIGAPNPSLSGIAIVTTMGVRIEGLTITRRISILRSLT
jgi:hypothetical protein